jgi:hypothetical protein
MESPLLGAARKVPGLSALSVANRLNQPDCRTATWRNTNREAEVSRPELSGLGHRLRKARLILPNLTT